MNSNNILKTIGFLKHKTITYKGLLVITGSLFLAVLIFSTCTGTLPDTYAHAVIAGAIADKTPEKETVVIPDTTTSTLERLISSGRKTAYRLNVNDTINGEFRKNMYVYQIGSVFTNEEAALDTYEKLYDVEYVYLIKITDTQYYLVNYNGKTKEKLDDFLKYFKTLTPGQITVINLTRFCPKEKNLLVGKAVRTTHKDKELNCLICK